MKDKDERDNWSDACERRREDREKERRKKQISKILTRQVVTNITKQLIRTIYPNKCTRMTAILYQHNTAN